MPTLSVAKRGGAARFSKGGYAVPLAVTVILGVLSALRLWKRSRKASVSREEAIAAATPAGSAFTMGSLAPFDGSGILPLYLGCCGKVVDCSTSENITYGQGYGKLWAGKDATYGLATLSLNGEDANQFDFELCDLTVDQLKTLASWYKHFTTRYPVVGTLREYEAWDFSEIHRLAKSQTPFGTNSDAKADLFLPAVRLRGNDCGLEESVELSEAQSSVESDTQLPEGCVVLNKGDRVMIVGCRGRPELIGTMGTLVDFKADDRVFLVDLDGGMGQDVFHPHELGKVASKATVAF